METKLTRSHDTSVLARAPRRRSGGQTGSPTEGALDPATAVAALGLVGFGLWVFLHAVVAVSTVVTLPGFGRLSPAAAPDVYLGGFQSGGLQSQSVDPFLDPERSAPSSLAW